MRTWKYPVELPSATRYCTVAVELRITNARTKYVAVGTVSLGDHVALPDTGERPALMMKGHFFDFCGRTTTRGMSALVRHSSYLGGNEADAMSTDLSSSWRTCATTACCTSASWRRTRHVRMLLPPATSSI